MSPPAGPRQPPGCEAATEVDLDHHTAEVEEQRRPPVRTSSQSRTSDQVGTCVLPKNAGRISLAISGEALVLLLGGEVAVGGHAGGLIGEMERAVGVGDRFGQAQRGGHGPLGEHLLAAAEQQRVQPQVQPVDEAEAQQ